MVIEQPQEMCKCAIIQYPITNIHYSMMARQIGYWLLAVGYLHIQHDRRIQARRKGNDGQPRHDFPRVTNSLKSKGE